MDAMAAGEAGKVLPGGVSRDDSNRRREKGGPHSLMF